MPWDDNKRQLTMADKLGLNVSELINEILREHLNQHLARKAQQLAAAVGAEKN